MQQYLLYRISEYTIGEVAGLHAFVGHPMFDPKPFFRAAAEAEERGDGTGMMGLVKKNGR